MGLSDRRPPPLPAPTETSSDNFGGNTTSDDLDTDVSRRTDFTSQTIPEDGSPITVATSKRTGRRDADAGGKNNQSQTSLLIEYFEGHRTGDKQQSRPSVRVRVTPSRAKAKEGEHVEVGEADGQRKPSYVRSIRLGGKERENVPLAAGTSDLSSFPPGSNLTGPPLEVELLPHTSDLSRSEIGGPTYPYPSMANASDVSSMPPDSTLEGDLRILSPPRSPLIDESVRSPSTLKAPERERSLSREREITHRVMEKIAQREASGKHSPSAKRTSSREYVIDSPSGRRTLSDRTRTEGSIRDAPSSINPSDISRRSERSNRSDTSKVSINNPKLLQTVEDAIRRLILPELNAVKEEQRLQRNMSKFEKRSVDSPTSARSEDGLTRRMSKSSSAPDVKGARPRVVVSRDGDEIGHSKVRRDRVSSRGSDRSERSRKTSSDTVVKGEERTRRRRSKDKSHLKDAALVAGGAALTAAALRHHASNSSIDSRDRERRRKRRSKSRSRTASISEEPEERDMDHRESIPPLPAMPSEIGTDLTRDSIMSVQTDASRDQPSHGVSTPPKDFEVRHVSRGSPREVAMDASPTTPTRNLAREPANLQRGLGSFHQNVSGPNIIAPHEIGDSGFRDSHAAAAAAAAGAMGGAAVISSMQDISGLHESMSANTLDHYTPQRPLSPIQSVSSYRDSTVGPVQHSRVQSIRSEASFTSPRKYGSRPISAHSADSYASSQSEFIHAKNRPAGFSLEPGYEIMEAGEYEPVTPTSGFEEATPRAVDMDEWLAKEHENNERYRQQYEEETDPGSDRDYNRLSGYTSSTGPYLDKVTEGQGLLRVGDNPEYVPTPVAVESAVASLHDPSNLSAPSSNGSPVKGLTPKSDTSYAARDAARQEARALGLHDNSSRERWGAIREKARTLSSQSQPSLPRDRSPQQSPALSDLSQPVKVSASALPVAGDELPAIGHGVEDEEMETNPSIIRGPMAGTYHGDRSHWPYEPTPPIASGKDLMRPSSDDFEHGHDAELGAALGAGALGGGVAGAAAGLGLAGLQGTGKQIDRSGDRDMPTYQQPSVDDGYEANEKRGYVPPPRMESGLQASSPNQLKDEGYMSAAQRDYTPEQYDTRDLDDPFRSKRQMKHMSGMSHGMESPLYDAATGKGIDRIQSKDVVALMDHLTVRDGQRNARDTEILVALVRGAAEMRNSFEDMKRFLEAQDRMVMQHTERNADNVVQKVVSGPRPQQTASPRALRRAPSSEDGGDATQVRRQNFVKRALKGLSMRSTNDLSNIESMLMQLLNEVEGLKEAQGRQQTTAPGSINSTDFLRQAQDPGYEPEGMAGTSSNPSQSGFLSNPSSRQLNGKHSGYGVRRSSANRISTVDERDEDEYNGGAGYGDEDRMKTPTQETHRASSMPMETPPQQHNVTFRASDPAEAELQSPPRTGKSSKYRSQSSSVFGNLASKVSRWSKTTTSSEPANRTSTERRQRPYSEASQSGSNLNLSQHHNEYPLNEDDRIRSNNSLAREQEQQLYQVGNVGGQPQGTDASPLVPDTASFEHPQYSAHRNSINLQHPQPRPGPTYRHQSHLETQAQTFYDSLLPDEMEQATWGSNPTLSLNRNMNRLSASTAGNLSPLYSDDGASVHSASEQTMSPARRRQQQQQQSQQQQQEQQQMPPPRPPKILEGEEYDEEEDTDDEDDDDDVHYEYTRAGAEEQQGLGSSGGTGHSSSYYATQLEPIQEARYSLETERTTGGGSNANNNRFLTPSPSLQQQQQQRTVVSGQQQQRRVTPAGPRAMGSSAPGSRNVSGAQQQQQPQEQERRAQQDDAALRRKPVSVRSAASSSLISYRSSLDDDDEIF